MEHLIPETARQAAVLPRKRRRPALSCAECRNRKVKCDRKNPCAPCKKYKTATCTYSQEGLSSLKICTPETSLSHSSTSIGDVPCDNRTIADEAIVAKVSEFSTAPRIHHDEIASSSGRSYLDSHSARFTQHVNQDLAHRVGRIEQVLSLSKIDAQVAEIANSRILPARELRGNMLKNRYFGHSHWMFALMEAESFMCFEIDVSDDEARMKLTNKEAEATINSALHSCKLMARAIKAAQAPQWTISGISFHHSIPIRSISDELVGHYLRTHESIYRILHIPSFRKEYAQYWASPQTTSIVSLIKISLVMAIGTCFYQGPDFDAHRTQAIQWIHSAQLWLGSPGEKSRLNTASIQVECLLLLARSIYNIGADILWNHTGSVLRTAMSMGFHRDPRYSKRYSILHNEIRRRLWATILEINIQACLDFGMSPMISIEEFDTEPPSNINDDDIDESTVTRPASHPSQVFTESSLQIALLSSLATRLEIANLVNGYRVESSYEEVIRLDKELLRNHKQDQLLFARAANTLLSRSRPTLFDQKIFDLKVQRFLLVLHQSFATKARNDPRFYYSHKIYLDTALAVHSVPSNKIVAPEASNDCETQDDYSRFRLISGGFLKEILIHSVIIIYQELVAPLEDHFRGFLQDETDTRRERYLRLFQDMVDLAYRRIEAGETAVKTHLMYSIALAHIKALESGSPSEEVMTEAAILSLSQCREVLKRRMPSMPMTLDEPFLNELSGTPELGVGDMDMSMQDWGMEFEPSDSWLFSGWPLNNIRG